MKRESVSEPLTADDVAERLTKALMRSWRILADVRQSPELWDEVKHSRYLGAGHLHGLAEELDLWLPNRKV